ncbi:MAG: aldehyde ferredoxin oxidoreductase family protein [Acidobacteria bacterium]|nr:aldehyde ferredoxin oxidoreductase family protein [Acidobacteriota bacterium]
MKGYYGVILEVDLTQGKVEKKELPEEDALKFVGGRGLGTKIVWDHLKKPYIDPLSPENPLIFAAGPFSGYPFLSASRVTVVTKSPMTSPVKPPAKTASTIGYSNMGGFFGPAIRFAGYDAIVITGRASSPVYLVIDGDKVDIRDAGRIWSKKASELEELLPLELKGEGFETCYIGPAGENLVRYAAIIHTVGRAAGRAGVGCVMGSKRLKAIAVRGKKLPPVANHKEYLKILEELRKKFASSPSTARWRRYGTAYALLSSSDRGTQAVKNYREGTFLEIDRIGGVAAEEELWVRDTACYACPLGCKKIGVVRTGRYAGTIAEGPEYETGTMLGANLLVSNLDGLMREIADVDDYGLDQISTGNVIGFLMEAYDKGLIDKAFLDGIDLRWGDVEAVLSMIKKIAYREGVGDIAADGLNPLVEKIGEKTAEFAIQVKGHPLAAWNVHTRLTQGLCYATANRGACHLNGHSARSQDFNAFIDSTGICRFASGIYSREGISKALSAITGEAWTIEDCRKTGERIFNLEKCFNYREGFRREDDEIPERFFTEPLTIGPRKGAVIKRDQFKELLDKYYRERGWDVKTTKPSPAKLRALGLDFIIKGLGD